MHPPIILTQTVTTVKRLVLDSQGGARLQHLTVHQEVALTADEAAQLHYALDHTAGETAPETAEPPLFPRQLMEQWRTEPLYEIG